MPRSCFPISWWCPFALGQDVRFEDGQGPVLGAFSGNDRLVRDVSVWEEKLAPVYEAMSAHA